MKLLVNLTIIFLCFNCVQAQNRQCYNSDSTYFFEGTLKYELFYGPPNFGEDPMHDKKEMSYILFLKENSCLNDTFFGNVDTFTTIHVIDIHGNLKLKKYFNKQVIVKATILPGHTGHHHAPVITGNLYDVQLLHKSNVK